MAVVAVLEVFDSLAIVFEELFENCWGNIGKREFFGYLWGWLVILLHLGLLLGDHFPLEMWNILVDLLVQLFWDGGGHQNLLILSTNSQPEDPDQFWPLVENTEETSLTKTHLSFTIEIFSTFGASIDSCTCLYGSLQKVLSGFCQNFLIEKNRHHLKVEDRSIVIHFISD